MLHNIMHELPLLQLSVHYHRVPVTDTGLTMIMVYNVIIQSVYSPLQVTM